MHQGYKMENNGFKNVCVKNRTCYYFDELIKLEDFEIDNILIDKKSQETILINGITYTILIGSKTLRIRFSRWIY